MQIRCPECQSALELEDSEASRPVKCRFCGHQFLAESQVEQSGIVPQVETGAPEPALDSPIDALAAAVAKGPRARPAPPFISPMTRAKLVLVLTIAAAVLYGISIWDSSLYIDMCERTLAGEEISEEELASHEMRGSLLTWPSIAASLGATVFFFIWNYRVYKNLFSLRADQIRFSPAGAIGWYFCPIINLWKPFQAMQDIQRGSAPERVAKSPRGGSIFVLFWWIVWVVDGIVAYACFKGGMRLAAAEDPMLTEVIAVFHLSITSDVVSIISAVLTIILIWMISTSQRQRYEDMSRPAPAMSAPQPSSNPYSGF